MSDEPRRHSRVPTNHELLVRCESWQEFVQRYATDISQGGMFIQSAEPLALFSEVEVQLRLPDGHDFVLKASVVHVIAAEQAAREGLQPGVGVHFVNLERMQRQQLQHLIEFARWEGASGQSAATYAHHMFEHSPSIQSGHVQKVLAQAPAPASRQPPPGAARNSVPTPRNVSQRPAARPSARPTRPPSQPVSKRPDTGRQRRTAKDGELDPARRTAPDGELGAARRTASDGSLGAPRAEASGAAGTPASTKAANPAKLKVAMTHLAHKRFGPAIKAFEEILAESPADRLAQQWVHVAHARTLLSKGKDDAAMERYSKALAIDETNVEARMFVREHASKKRMNALPFGRYFVKKS